MDVLFAKTHQIHNQILPFNHVQDILYMFDDSA